MWKPPSNPTVIEQLNNWRERRMNLADIEPVALEDGKKGCAWCLHPLRGRQQKWCSQSCSDSAFAYCNPQSEYGLSNLLAKQSYRCKGCDHDWNPLADSLLGTRGIPKFLQHYREFNIRLLKGVKRYADKGRKPEVDHIVPIALGGSPLNLSNLQALCYTCHKAKTKIQNSGPRPKRKKR